MTESGVLVHAEVDETRSDALKKPRLLFRFFFQSVPTIFEKILSLVAL